MLDLAIPIYADDEVTVVQASSGKGLRVQGWPYDCDSQLVAFSSSWNTCEIILADDLAADIGAALKALDKAGVLKGGKPDWYQNLKRCAEP